MKRMAASILMIGLAISVVAGCGSPAQQSDGSSAQGGNARSEEAYAPNIDPADFTTRIDNKYFPLEPGTTFVYGGKTQEGTERIEVTITNDAKRVAGVECVVVRDKVFLDGGLIEDTFDWYAQDKKGNVWYFGEDTRQYQDGRVASTKGAWEAGVDGARPGVAMRAQPQVGDRYRQEYAPGEAEDMGQVLSLRQRASVPVGTFDAVVIKNSSRLDPGSSEDKFYASGVGAVLGITVEGGGEWVELVEMTVP